MIGEGRGALAEAGSRCKRGGKVDADKYARHEGSSPRVVRAFLLYPRARSRAINPRDG